jgi:hypothetical protein
MAGFNYLKLLSCRTYLQLRQNYYGNKRSAEITRKEWGPLYKALLKIRYLRSLYWEQIGTNKKRYDFLSKFSLKLW